MLLQLNFTAGCFHGFGFVLLSRLQQFFDVAVQIFRLLGAAFLRGAIGLVLHGLRFGTQFIRFR